MGARSARGRGRYSTLESHVGWLTAFQLSGWYDQDTSERGWDTEATSRRRPPVRARKRKTQGMIGWLRIPNARPPSVPFNNDRAGGATPGSQKGRSRQRGTRFGRQPWTPRATAAAAVPQCHQPTVRWAMAATTSERNGEWGRVGDGKGNQDLAAPRKSTMCRLWPQARRAAA